MGGSRFPRQEGTVVTDEPTRIVVNGIKAYEGEYELATDRAFNAREWHWIKKIAGYMPNTVNEGLAGDDPDLYVALAVIAMCRAGRVDRADGLRVADVLSEAPFGSIDMVFPEAPDVPLELTGQPEQPSQNGSPSKTSSSGPSSPNTSDSSDRTPSSIGTSESDTSARLSVLKAQAS